MASAKATASGAEFLGIDIAIIVYVAANEPAVHWLVQFFHRYLLVTVDVN